MQQRQLFSPRTQGGFTLVEISVVLIIIGLLLGGVLRGGELIDNTKVKSVYNAYRELTVAAFGYQDRYGAVPGDDSRATTRGLPTGPTAVTNGNGNGFIENGTFNCQNGNTANEACQALYQLRLGGFIAGTDTSAPNHAFGGRVALARADNFIGGFGRPVSVCFEWLDSKAIRQLETKYDDGTFNTGVIRGNVNYEFSGVEATCVAS
jgi:prepilin-type N-terminal cleavage/methylation domain-containing protein